VLEILARAIRQEKENKRDKNRKESNQMISTCRLCGPVLENPKD
jgi:hypothetical protein